MKTDEIVTKETSGEFLRKVCRETSWDEIEDLNLIPRLLDALETSWTFGVGLAAIQIGVPLRFALYVPKRFDKRALSEPVFLMNPKIIGQRFLTPVNQEGCLSITNARFNTWRYSHIKYQTELQENIEVREVVGFEAAVVQHEIDHMDGIICSDRTTKPKEPGRNDACHCGSGKKFKRCHA